MTKMSEIWGAKDENAVPVNRLDAPTKAMDVKREIIWLLTQAQNFIISYIGSGGPEYQSLVDKACHFLEISESEYMLCMCPEAYNGKNGIDLVRVQDIGRQATKMHMAHDLTRYIYASSSAKQDLNISALTLQRLWDRKYEHFTINELRPIWDDIPSQYRTLTL